MNGSEKSDRRVVPARSPNKGERRRRSEAKQNLAWGTKAETPETEKGTATVSSAMAAVPAEGLEERRLAKGNPHQRPTHRTQGRARVSPPLARIRRAARKDRKKRFTALLHHVYCRYYGVPFNSQAIQRFRFRAVRLWQRALSRRSQRGYVRWSRMKRLAQRWIPRARVQHPYPEQRVGRLTRGRSPVR